MLFQVLAIIGCYLACLLQFAAHRAPDVKDFPNRRAARKITMVALLVAGSYLSYTLYSFGVASNMLCLVAGLFALGQILFAMGSLFDGCTAESRKGMHDGTHA